jgi:hypothetical protein
MVWTSPPEAAGDGNILIRTLLCGEDGILNARQGSRRLSPHELAEQERFIFRGVKSVPGRTSSEASLRRTTGEHRVNPTLDAQSSKRLTPCVPARVYSYYLFLDAPLSKWQKSCTGGSHYTWLHHSEDTHFLLTPSSFWPLNQQEWLIAKRLLTLVRTLDQRVRWQVWVEYLLGALDAYNG